MLLLIPKKLYFFLIHFIHLSYLALTIQTFSSSDVVSLFFPCIIEKYSLSMCLQNGSQFDPRFKLSVARRQNCKLLKHKKNVAEKDRSAIKIGMRSGQKTVSMLPPNEQTDEKKKLAVARPYVLLCQYTLFNLPISIFSHSMCSVHRILS